MVYFGPVLLCKAYFSDLGYRSPAVNPAEFVVYVATKAQEAGKSSVPALHTTAELADIARQRLKGATRTVPLTLAKTEQGEFWLVDFIRRETVDLPVTIPLVLTLLQRDFLSLSRRNYVFLICTRMFLIGVFMGEYMLFMFALSKG